MTYCDNFALYRFSVFVVYQHKIADSKSRLLRCEQILCLYLLSLLPFTKT